MQFEVAIICDRIWEIILPSEGNESLFLHFLNSIEWRIQWSKMYLSSKIGLTGVFWNWDIKNTRFGGKMLQNLGINIILFSVNSSRVSIFF